MDSTGSCKVCVSDLCCVNRHRTQKKPFFACFNFICFPSSLSLLGEITLQLTLIQQAGFAFSVECHLLKIISF